jgi:hypothetical protein
MRKDDNLSEAAKKNLSMYKGIIERSQSPYSLPTSAAK